MPKILIIAPHPDDEVLGCGGTMARYAAEGKEVYLCIATAAYTPDWSLEFINGRPREVQRANEILGVKKTFFLDFPTAKLDIVPQKELNQAIVGVIEKVQPEIVFIPSRGDLNCDHRLIFDATLVALRPSKSKVRKILTYETMSETEWGKDIAPFVPNVYIDISAFIEKKISAMEAYSSEMQEHPHPRSLQNIKIAAQKRGSEALCEYAEAFSLVRETEFNNVSKIQAFNCLKGINLISDFTEIIPITKPTLPPKQVLDGGLEKIFSCGMLTNANFVKEFEAKSAEYFDCKHAIAVSSCTSGLILIFKCLGINGEVIMPSFTFHATGHSLLWNNITPVFVDCDKQTFNISPEKIEQAITSKTAAILAVHIFGNPADINTLEKISQKNNLKLIFDAAHGFGADYGGSKLGRFGDASSFSLSPTKLVTSGEGGIITTNDDMLADKIRIARNYGDSGDYDCVLLGLNARMSELNALLGIKTLEMLPDNIAKRQKLVETYKQILNEIPGISFQSIARESRCSFKDFAMLIDKKKFGLSRDELAEMLLKKNIFTKKYFYPPLHKQKLYIKFVNPAQEFANTDDLSGNLLHLPLYSHMPADEVVYVCDVIKKIHWTYKKS